MEDYIFEPIRSSAIITTSYVAGTVLDLASKYNKVALLIDFTKGSLTTAEIKVEFSPDNTNWYQEVSSSASNGTITDKLAEHQISADGKYRVPLTILDRYMRVSVKGTGTATNSLMKVDAVLVSTEN